MFVTRILFIESCASLLQSTWHSVWDDMTHNRKWLGLGATQRNNEAMRAASVLGTRHRDFRQSVEHNRFPALAPRPSTHRKAPSPLRLPGNRTRRRRAPICTSASPAQVWGRPSLHMEVPHQATKRTDTTTNCATQTWTEKRQCDIPIAQQCTPRNTCECLTCPLKLCKSQSATSTTPVPTPPRCRSKATGASTDAMCCKASPVLHCEPVETTGQPTSRPDPLGDMETISLPRQRELCLRFARLGPARRHCDVGRMVCARLPGARRKKQRAVFAVTSARLGRALWAPAPASRKSAGCGL